MNDPRVPFLAALACCCAASGFWLLGALAGARALYLANQ